MTYGRKSDYQDRADAIRRSVRATEIIGKLHEHIIDGKELTATQVRAAEILLKKSVPDLSAVTLESGPEGINVNINKFIA